jgi:two-component system, chemotaxis family, CheB/CheR fusion protein
VLSMLGVSMTSLVGKRIEETDIPLRAPEIASNIHRNLQHNEATRLQTRIRNGGEERPVEIIVRPLFTDTMERTGTLIYFDDGSLQEKLQTTIEVLESTTEELQSANEELETTNEELQSTNEELETTNEELQSTNEELETTNEELQSLNEELETTNQELEERTKELDQLNSIYGQTLEQMRLPVLLVDSDGRIEFWNSIALRMFGFRSRPPMSFRLEQLPLPVALRNVLIRRYSAVLHKRQPMVARNLSFGGKFSSADVHLSVIPREDNGTSVLFMFEPRNSPEEPERKGAARRKRPG